MCRYFLIFLMLLCFPVSAGIYKWVDEKGDVHYSDKEEKGAEQVNLPAAVTYTPTTSATGTAGKADPEEKQGYTAMSIVQPKMNETIRSSNGDVPVMIDLKPGLQKGDGITLYLDGKEVLKGSTQTSVTLSNVNRGSHTLRASVFNKNNVSMISSKSIIFHLKRESADTKDNTPKENSEAFTPEFNQDESKKEDFKKDFKKDYGKDFDKDFDSSNTYKEEGKKYNNGVPSSSGTFKSGPKTYSPNYNQKP